ncbi:hypothetical protein QOZ80_8BG0663230 [Eleusine coracana subsp. coracana]|nr:hypothetical protein QOZ80_8BG0663230 [Eleusine coracana subsp. coracana]
MVDQPRPLPLPTAFPCPSSVPHLRRTHVHHRIGRVVSDLSHANHRKATTDHCVLRHQSTSNNENSSNVAGGQAKLLRFSLLFTGISAWRRRSDGTGDDTGRTKSKKEKHADQETGKRRGDLHIGQVVSKYWSMLEQLFTSSSSAGRKKRDGSSSELRHTFTSSRGGSGNAPSSKRHKGRLSSAPASLRGSPANSGYLSIGESVKTMSTSSELSTMEELQSAVQAAIAHCKSSAAASKQAAAGDDDRCKC